MFFLMKDKLVSIIVPVYNAERYLRACIESALSQTYENFELILIDDGSVDSSYEICVEYAKKDSRIKTFHKINEGVSVARNVGLDNACGEWIVFADADDLLEKKALASLIVCAERTQSEVALASLDVLTLAGCRQKYRHFVDCDNADFLPIKHYALWGYIFKRSVIEKNSVRFVPNLAYSEDRVFLYAISRYCKTMSTSSDVVYIYRKNLDSVCASGNAVRKFEQHIFAANCLRKMKDEVKNEGRMILFLNKEIRHVISLGFYVFVSLPFDYNDLKSVNKIYRTYFTNRMFFLFCFAIQFFTFKRRNFQKIIRRMVCR